MTVTVDLSNNTVDNLKLKALHWANSRFNTICFLDNNSYPNYQHATYEGLLAVGCKERLSCMSGNGFNRLKKFHNKKKDWLFGFLGYDLKNETEDLSSKNIDNLQLPDLFFFQPEYVLEFHFDRLVIHAETADAHQIANQIINCPAIKSPTQPNINLKPRISKQDYINTVKLIKKHISIGDIYELNFCQEFFAEETIINPLHIFKKLNTISKSPFSAFFKNQGKYLLSASPERFLKKTGQQIISQPIKGTIHKGTSEIEDILLCEQLKNDPKELAENIMIVDLVRNDLSKSCIPGSVEVEELCAIKSFEQVHQLVSTVRGTLQHDIHFSEVLKNTFPMGSMTGAPKVMAMKLIEQYEQTKRGLYSGAVGYITPDGDFDFNVVIRSLIYNQTSNYLSYHTGSAITANSIPEKEYEECLLKAAALKQLTPSIDEFATAN